MNEECAKWSCQGKHADFFTTLNMFDVGINSDDYSLTKGFTNQGQIIVIQLIKSIRQGYSYSNSTKLRTNEIYNFICIKSIPPLSLG